MNERPQVLQYALPARRRPPAWMATEAWLAALPNAVLALIVVVGWLGGWNEWVGMAAGLFIVAFALMLTVIFIAVCGVFVAYVDGPTSAYRQRTAWLVLAIAAGHGGLFVAILAGIVALA